MLRPGGGRTVPALDRVFDQVMSVISWWYPHRFGGTFGQCSFSSVLVRVSSTNRWWQYGASALVRGVFTSEQL